jgi:hypothetical protein
MLKLVIITALAAMAILFWRNWSRQRRAAYIDNFPYQKWLDQRLAERRPELTADQRGEVFVGLRDYFQICRIARRRMVSMPSQVVDDAWHEFILFTRQYDKFCRHGFGRFLHHTPAAAMSSPTRPATASAAPGGWPAPSKRLTRKSRNACPGCLRSMRRWRLPAASSISSTAWLPHRGAAGSGFCASHIGCSSGCSGDSGSSSSDSRMAVATAAAVVSGD